MILRNECLSALSPVIRGSSRTPAILALIAAPGLRSSTHRTADLNGRTVFLFCEISASFLFRAVDKMNSIKSRFIYNRNLADRARSLTTFAEFDVVALPKVRPSRKRFQERSSVDSQQAKHRSA